ncbi:MAG: hypothetical protein J5503_05750 [Muribaculaceae bacterium]|nr:hypothetical protein [Muribaculaceae bacterium]
MMKRYSQQHIKALLDKYMDGRTTIEEEKALADFFRTHDVPAEWEDYRVMFDFFDRGMEGELLPTETPNKTLASLMEHRWWGIGAAAAITAAIVGTAVLYHPSSSTPSPTIAKQQVDTPVVIQSTTEMTAPQLTTTTPGTQTSSMHRVNATSQVRRLQAHNDKLTRENERLQRELDDLKRRAFIIDLEANGYKTVLNEDGSIVLIDMEQEIENELNNQPTTNIPAL